MSDRWQSVPPARRQQGKEHSPAEEENLDGDMDVGADVETVAAAVAAVGAATAAVGIAAAVAATAVAAAVARREWGRLRRLGHSAGLLWRSRNHVDLE